MPDTWNWTNYDTKSNFSWSPPHTLKTNGGITYFVRFQLNAAAPPSPPLKIFLAVQQVRPGPSLILGGERGGTKFKITMSFQKVNVLDFEVPLVKAHRKYQVFAKIIKGFGKRVQFHVSTDVAWIHNQRDFIGDYAVAQNHFQFWTVSARASMYWCQIETDAACVDACVE